MQPASPYDRPDLYDLVAPPDADIARFYVDMARMRGNRVLDLACGTGRFTIPLAKAGNNVVGADLSTTMLQRARLAAQIQGVEIEWLQLDMRDFDLDRPLFDTIILAANSIMHLHTINDFRGFFSCVARHLAPDGRLVFDAFVPSLTLLGSAPDLRHPVGSFTDDTLGDVQLEETVRYDPIAQISHVDWFWSTRTQKDFWQTTMQLRQIFPQELPLLVALGGLQLLDRFGDFDRRPLTARSYRQISVCAKA